MIQSTINETKSQFKELFNIQFPSQTIYSNNEIFIKAHWGDDADGIYFGYQVFKDNENISNSETALVFKPIFKEINEISFYSNSYYIGWFNPKPFNRGDKFEKLDKKEIFKMNNDQNALRKFVSELIEQENKVRQAFLSRL